MLILLTIAVIIVHMAVVWIIYRWLENPSVVDVAWETGLMLCGWVYILGHGLTSRSLIIGLVLLLWGLRLGGYIFFTRIYKGHVDKRYLNLSKDWKVAKPLGFFVNFQFQGLLIFLISCSWYFIGNTARSSINFSDAILIILALLCISGETLADMQLQQFKKDHPGAVCNTGLWRYSRHPNYFFEWLIWCIFCVLALNSIWSIISIISPVTLYLLMTQVTGPMTEAGSLKSRGEAYKAYQKQTSYFFPWFYKK